MAHNKKDPWCKRRIELELDGHKASDAGGSLKKVVLGLADLADFELPLVI